MAPETLKLALCNGKIQYPIIFRKKLQHFECLKWTLGDWASKTRGVQLPFRFVKRESFNNGPCWEGDAVHTHASLGDIIQWLDVPTEDLENDLARFPKEEYWCYSSYNYMAEAFKDNQEILQAVDWREFGFSKTGMESTFWFGTEGAYTPCHMDTYGCNIVAQLIGRKLWVLFPPEDSEFLYPTRIPYEESSVFSSVHISRPSLDIHPDFTKCHPYVATLNPGDVLFVPHHWWHFVQCEDVSVSVNMWIDLDIDKECRLLEAVAKILMTAFITTYEPNDGESWLNPTEELAEPLLAEQQLKSAIEMMGASPTEATSSDVTDDKIAAKRPKLASTSNDISEHLNLENECGYPVPPVQFEKLSEYFPNFFVNASDEARTTLSSDCKSVKQVPMRKLLDCFTNQEVITLIAQKLKHMVL